MQAECLTDTYSLFTKGTTYTVVACAETVAMLLNDKNYVEQLPYSQINDQSLWALTAPKA